MTGKRSYETEQEALEALVGARIGFDCGRGSGPVNCYQCHDCGDYHLTSKGAMHPLLEDPDTVKRIKLEKEAQNWERKLR